MKYVVWNSCNDDLICCDSQASAEELILSIAEEEAYKYFCITGAENYFNILKFHKDFNDAENKNMSIAGYALWLAGYTYDIKEVKYVF